MSVISEALDKLRGQVVEIRTSADALKAATSSGNDSGAQAAKVAAETPWYQKTFDLMGRKVSYGAASGVAVALVLLALLLRSRRAL